MRYLIILAIVLVISLLASKVLLAINLVRFNKFDSTKEVIVKTEISEQLLEVGKPIYLVHCSSCHGKDGKGNNDKAQDHTKRIAKKSVLDVIKNGSNNFQSIYPAGMPAGLINNDEAKDVAKYVANGLQGDKPKAWQVCASCHDDSGEGITFVAPDIKNYSDDFVNTVLFNGKKGVIGTMPNFKGRLTDIQIKALATYIRSLGKSV